MTLIAKFLAALSGVIHVSFFFMESVFWKNPAVHQKFTVSSPTDAETIAVFIQNQGFYNLFLALGIFAALLLVNRHPSAGRALIIYICLFMIGASVVLFFTVPAMLSGVFIQGIPPLLTLLVLRFSDFTQKKSQIG